MSKLPVHTQIGFRGVARAWAVDAAGSLSVNLDRLALVHGAVAVRHPVEVRDPIEDAAGLDPAFEDVRSSTGLATRPL